MSYRLKHVVSIALPLAVGLLVAACDGGPPSAPPAAIEKYVFTSAMDCAEKGILSLQRCGEIIDAAVADHERKAPSYKSERACEATEGAERCEVAGIKSFRPRLMAFAVVIQGEQAVAGPLYLTLGGEAGFRAADKQLYLTTDEAITFSAKATALYESSKLAAAAAGGGSPL